MGNKLVIIMQLYQELCCSQVLIHCSTIAQVAKPFTVGVSCLYTNKTYLHELTDRVEEVHWLKVRANRPRTSEIPELRTLMELLACLRMDLFFQTGSHQPLQPYTQISLRYVFCGKFREQDNTVAQQNLPSSPMYFRTMKMLKLGRSFTKSDLLTAIS